jgi:hypothetical protein
MGKPLNLFLLHQGKPTDERDLPFEQGLKGKHRADFRTVKNIKKESLNDIVFVVAQGDFVTFETMGNMKKTFSSFPGTEETRIFPILSAIRPNPDISELHMIRKPSCFKETLQDLGPTGIKTKVNVNG